MITRKSFVNEASELGICYPVFVNSEFIKNDSGIERPVWTFSVFDGEIDGDVTLGILDEQTLILDVIPGWRKYSTVDLAIGYIEGWFMQDVIDDELDHYGIYGDELRILVSKHIKNNVSEQELLLNVMGFLIDEINECINFEKSHVSDLEDAYKSLKKHMK